MMTGLPRLMCGMILLVTTLSGVLPLAIAPASFVRRTYSCFFPVSRSTETISSP